MAELNISSREVKASAAKYVREKSCVPGIIYGSKSENLPFYTDYLQLTKIMSGGHFYNKILTLKLNDKEVIQVLPKAAQTHPQNDRILHVDMLRVNPDSVVKVKVPVHATGVELSTALKQGALLNMVLNSVEVQCKVADIPTKIEVDVSTLYIGQNVHVKDLTISDNVKIITADDQAVLSIAGRVEEEVAQEAE